MREPVSLYQNKGRIAQEGLNGRGQWNHLEDTSRPVGKMKGRLLE
jgi:hypothetical protein